MTTKTKAWRSDSLSFVKAIILTLHCPRCNAAIMIENARHKLWPLVTATFVVDFLAEIWRVTLQPERWSNPYSVALLTAFTLGQVGVVAIWLAYCQSHDA